MLSIALIAMGMGSVASPWPVISARAEANYLSSQLNRTVTVPATLANHLLYVRRSGAHPESELRAAAAALRATVSVSNGGYAFVRTEEDDRKYLATWAAGREKWIEERVKRAEKYRRDDHADDDPARALRIAIDNYEWALEHLGAPSRHDVSVEANTCQLGPSGRLMLDALRSVGVSAIASTPLGRATIFETVPRGDALPLPDFDPALRRYEDLLVPLQSFRPPTDLSHPLETSGLLAGVGQSAAAPACARLAVSPHPGYLMLAIEAFDQHGNLVGQDAFPMSANNLDITGPGSVVAMAQTPHAKRVPIPTALRALAANPPNGSCPRWLREPANCEPLSVYASFAMDQLIGPEARCAVVDMSDGLIEDALAATDGTELNLDAFHAVLEGFDPYEKVMGSTFEAWRPINPFEGDPADRQNIQAFVHSTLEAGYIDIRALSKAGEPPSRLRLLCVRMLRSLTNPDIDDLHASIPNYGFLGLLRGIGDQDWAALMSGQTMTAAQMGVTKNLLVLFDEFGLSTDAKNLPARYQHPAELYSNGEFDETPIRIIVQSEPVYRMTGSSAPRWTTWDSQMSGVIQLSIRSRLVDGVPYLDMNRDQFEAVCDERFRFQTGERKRTLFQILLPGGNAVTTPLPRPISDVSSPVTYSDLPKELRDRTWDLVSRAALARLKRSG